jgi:hypothetical protein
LIRAALNLMISARCSKSLFHGFVEKILCTVSRVNDENIHVETVQLSKGTHFQLIRNLRTTTGIRIATYSRPVSNPLDVSSAVIATTAGRYC